MVTQIPRLVLAWTLAGMLWLVLPCVSADHSSDFEDPCLTYLPGRFSEFLVETNGTVVLFPEDYNAPVRVWRNGQWSEDKNLTTEGPVRDIAEKAPGHWLVLSQPSQQEVLLYEYTAGSLRQIERITGRFFRPTLHPAADGTVWITSAGSAYGVKDGTVEIHGLGPELVGSQSTYYPATRSFLAPDRGLWFWSHTQYEVLNAGRPSKPVIEGFHVYQDGEWRIISHGGGELGGAVLADPKTVVIGSRYKEILGINVDSGELIDMDYPLPPHERCLFLHQTPAGHFLVMTARPFLSDHSHMLPPPVFDGRLSQLLAIENGKVRALLQGVDFKRISYDKGRPVVDVQGGTFLAESQSGLLFVSADLNTVRRLDWKFRVPIPNINRMRVSGLQLCILDRERGFAILDSHRLIHTGETAESGRWFVTTTLLPPLFPADGSVWYPAVSSPTKLHHWTGTNETVVPMPSLIPEVHHLTTDTKNRLWLIHKSSNRGHAFRDQERWRVFENRETAYSTVAKEEAGHPEYRVGNPSDRFYPVFAGDGRVAYRNEIRRLSVFDGKDWTPSPRDRVTSLASDKPPFYLDGVLTVLADNVYHQYVNGKWELLYKAVKSPYEEDTPTTRPPEVPGSFPGNASDCPIRLRDNRGTLWMGNMNHLWRGLNDVWVPFNIQESPLGLASSITSIQMDGAEGIWFFLRGGEYTRLARYQPSGAKPEAEWAEIPAAQIETDSMTLRVRIAGSGKLNVLRHQLNDGAWQQISVTSSSLDVCLENLHDGEHTLRVQVFDELLRASERLEHSFTVKRDHEKEIRKWVPLLQSPDFSQKEQAAGKLEKIGSPALPMLTDLEKDADQDTRWWIQAIKDEIEQSQQRTTP